MVDPSKRALLDRVFAATSTEESKKLYNKWAEHYNDEMIEHEFTAPYLVVQAVLRGLRLNDSHKREEVLSIFKVLDAGCGTGAVGIECAKLGAKDIDGLDLSEGMLGVARRTGIYNRLSIKDLTEKLEIDDGTYDVVTCCGTFTHGHLGPEPMAELVRVTRRGGVFVATVLDSHWVGKGFEAEVQQLEKDGQVELVEKNVHAYRKDSGGGVILVLRKL